MNFKFLCLEVAWIRLHLFKSTESLSAFIGQSLSLDYRSYLRSDYTNFVLTLLGGWGLLCDWLNSLDYCWTRVSWFDCGCSAVCDRGRLSVYAFLLKHRYFWREENCRFVGIWFSSGVFSASRFNRDNCIWVFCCSCWLAVRSSATFGFLFRGDGEGGSGLSGLHSRRVCDRFDVSD